MLPSTLKTQRGAAVLAVTMLLLLGMTLIVFFANRTLIFEQKTSANQVRSTIAQATADAGLEWAIANLNLGKKVDTTCTIITNPGANDKLYRDRYLDPNTTGSFAGPFAAISTGCVNVNGALTCSCPTTGNASFGTSTGPAFSVAYNTVAGHTDMVEVVATGCDAAALPCVAGAASTSDSTAISRQIVKLAPALATPPAAALTAGGDVSFGSNAINVTNADESTNGITVNAGGTITGKVSASTITTVPGTPVGASLVSGDTSLSSLSGAQFFQTFFGVSESTFQNAPTTTQITCSSGCETALSTAISQGVSNLYSNGDMSLSGNGTYGSATAPVILVVHGNFHVNGGVTIYGVVYCDAITWDETGGGNASIIGAAIAQGNFTATGTPNPTYDPKVLAALKKSGQFAKVMGSWRDF